VSPYYKYSEYLKNKYGEKVYKLTANLPVTCPNRDNVGRGGCIYCGDDGAGFESLAASHSVSQQLDAARQRVFAKYKANKFIAYFQNFTSTFLPLNQLCEYIRQAAEYPDVVKVAISTRPDCVSDAYLAAIGAICDARGIDICIELGLQSANPATLRAINRGHGLAEFIDAVIRIKAHGMQVCAHAILDLPWDDLGDNIECARILSALGINQVKIHNLFILKNTPLAKMYESGEFIPITSDEYIERAITFLEHLSPNIAIGRITGRSPAEKSVFSNWGKSWWRIHDEILAQMARDGRHQGGLCDYLNGAALNSFIDTKQQ